MLERKIERETREGLRMRLLDGAEAGRIAPYLSPDILAAGYSPDEGHADSRAVTPAFAAAARRAGGRYPNPRPHPLPAFRGGRFRGAKRRDGPCMPTKSLSPVAPGRRKSVRSPICTSRSTRSRLLMNATERTRPFIPQLIQHVGRRLSMKQTHAGNILIGGGWASRLMQTPDGGFDLSRRPEMIEDSLAGNLRAAIDTVPGIEPLNLIRSWTGTTAISADQLPIVGEVPRMPGFWIAGGGSAFTLGPSFARLIAQAMGGRPAAELDIVSPARFEHLNSFMG